MGKFITESRTSLSLLQPPSCLAESSASTNVCWFNLVCPTHTPNLCATAEGTFKGRLSFPDPSFAELGWGGGCRGNVWGDQSHQGLCPASLQEFASAQRWWAESSSAKSWPQPGVGIIPFLWNPEGSFFITISKWEIVFPIASENETKGNTN